MHHLFRSLALVAIALAAVAPAARADDLPCLGRWALTPAPGGAGWLDIHADGNHFAGALLWMGGSPEPFTTAYFEKNTLTAIRMRTDLVKDATGKITGSEVRPLILKATFDGANVTGTFAEPSGDFRSLIATDFSGARIPDLPPAPDLRKLKFRKPIALFNGKDLKGWAVFGGAHWAAVKGKDGTPTEGWVAKDDSVANGWSARDGELVNEQKQPEGKHLSFGNLATIQEFTDFNLTLDVKVEKNGNSGVYLRGLYEVQVSDTFGKPLDPHNMGAVYARITPSEAAERPAGEWQHLDITLVDRHVTVKLNDTLIIDNQPLLGCTGGALWSDESRPGPIYLQGDHTGVKYRNILLRPIKK